MHEHMPWISEIRNHNIHIEEYFHEHIVGEHVDCHQAYIGKVSICSGHVQTAYVDPADQTLPEVDRMTAYHETFG